MDNLWYLAAAYTIIFAVIFLYVLFLWRRQAGLNAEMRALEARLDELQSDVARESQRGTRSSGH